MVDPIVALSGNMVFTPENARYVIKQLPLLPVTRDPGSNPLGGTYVILLLALSRYSTIIKDIVAKHR